MDLSVLRKVAGTDLRKLIAGGLALFVFSVAIAIHWRPGTIGHHDSAYYLDGARHLAQGAGFVSAESDLNGRKLPIANWPPGFSLLMVPGLWLGFSVHASAAFVLGASYVVLLLSTYALLLVCTRSDHWPFALASCLVFGLTPSLLDMLNRLLSDLPMSAVLVLSLAFSVALLRALPSLKRGYVYSVLLAGLLAAVVLIRWAAMFAVFGVMAAFLVYVPLRTWRKLWKEVVAFTAVGGGLVGGWMLRNWLLTGEIMGQRNVQSTDPTIHLERALSGVLLWATDVRDFCGAKSGAWFSYRLLLGSMVVLGVLALGSKKMKVDSALGIRVLILTAVAYFFGMIFSASNHAFNSLLHPRYWIFVWAALLCLAFTLSASASGWLKWPLRGVFSLSLLLYFWVGVGQYLERHEAALALQRTRAAPVQEVAEEMSKRKCQIVSNDNRVLMVTHGYDQLFRFPSSKNQLRELSTRGSICVVWVRPEGDSRLRVAKKQRLLLHFAEKKEWIHLDRRGGTYEIWLPGPS
jgi:hypothetical protein